MFARKIFRFVLSLLAVALSCLPTMAQHYTVSGYVTDAVAEETTT